MMYAIFDDAIRVGRACPFCGKYNEVVVSEADYLDWKDGEQAQKAFPYLPAYEREVLISGVCPDCWDEMFGEEK